MIRNLIRLKGIWITMLFMLLLVGLAALSQPAFAQIASGTEGTCSWVIDDNGVLTISPTSNGSGTLGSYVDSGSGNPSWSNYKSQIKKVVVQPGVKTASGCYRLFWQLTNCTEMDLAHLNTSAATYMGYMFEECNLR